MAVLHGFGAGGWPASIGIATGLDFSDTQLEPAFVPNYGKFGAEYLDRVNKHSTAKRLARRLDALGYDVTLRPKATA